MTRKFQTVGESLFQPGLAQHHQYRGDAHASLCDLRARPPHARKCRRRRRQPKPTKTTSQRLGQCSQNMRPINTVTRLICPWRAGKSSGDHYIVCRRRLAAESAPSLRAMISAVALDHGEGRLMFCSDSSRPGIGLVRRLLMWSGWNRSTSMVFTPGTLRREALRMRLVSLRVRQGGAAVLVQSRLPAHTPRPRATE